MPNLPRKLSRTERLKADWLNQLLDYVRSITPRGNGKTIQVQRTPGGSTISATGIKRGGGGKGQTGNAYDGFFKVTDSSDEHETEVTVSDGYVPLGLNTLYIPEDTLLISSSGYVYWDITYNGSYTATLAFLGTWPEQLIDSYAIPVAYVKHTAPVPPATVGSISIKQLHYGVHYGAGRVF